MPFMGGEELWINIGTTQCLQYDFLGWSHVIGRNFMIAFEGEGGE